MSWAIITHIDQGVAADRPAANAVPGRHYGWWSTDTKELSISDGSTWTVIGPGTGGGVTYGTPALTLGTAAAAGSTDEAIRRDSTIVAFDATNPTTQAFGDAAATGSAAVAARRDHKHAMPATPTTVSGNAGTATALQTARAIDGVSFDGTADITVIAPGTHAATGKTTPVDADELPLVDSAASNVLKKLTWANLKATLKAYTDTLYTAIGASAPPNGSAGGVLDGSYPNPGLAAGVAGSGLAETADVLSVNVDGSTIEINADALRVKAGGIGANELASTAVTPTTYGDATHVGQFTVDADGRITGASAVAITGTGSGAGLLELVYRYTVTGSDKASIDTGADTPDAGSNDWTSGDLLEIYIIARTDEAVTDSGLACTVNNDTGSNYDRQNLSGINTAASAATSRGTANWLASCPGASATASNFGSVDFTIPNYAGTVAFKSGALKECHAETTAANCKAALQGVTWRSTAAITRFKVTPNTAAKKLKVGSQLLIYKRKSA